VPLLPLDMFPARVTGLSRSSYSAKTTPFQCLTETGPRGFTTAQTLSQPGSRLPKWCCRWEMWYRYC